MVGGVAARRRPRPDHLRGDLLPRRPAAEQGLASRGGAGGGDHPGVRHAVGDLARRVRLDRSADAAPPERRGTRRGDHPLERPGPSRVRRLPGAVGGRAGHPVALVGRPRAPSGVLAGGCGGSVAGRARRRARRVGHPGPGVDDRRPPPGHRRLGDRARPARSGVLRADLAVPDRTRVRDPADRPHPGSGRGAGGAQRPAVAGFPGRAARRGSVAGDRRRDRRRATSTRCGARRPDRSAR